MVLGRDVHEGPLGGLHRSGLAPAGPEHAELADPHLLPLGDRLGMCVLGGWGVGEGQTNRNQAIKQSSKDEKK